MHKYGLSIKFKTKEKNGIKLSTILLKTAQLISTAKGCQLYLVSLDNEIEDTVWITEIWDSKEDRENSLSTIGVKELLDQANALLTVPPIKGKEIRIIGGYGINP